MNKCPNLLGSWEAVPLVGLCISLVTERCFPSLWQILSNLEGNFEQEIPVTADARHSCVALTCKQTEGLMDLDVFPCHLFPRDVRIRN